MNRNVLNINGKKYTYEDFYAAENLLVDGSLYLRDTSITALPESLSVGGDLDLRGTAITALPEGLSVGGGLYLRGTSITAYRTSEVCFLNLPIWPVRIQADNIKIGCQRHSASEWFDFEDTQIKAMQTRALDWWREHKQIIHDEWQKLKIKGVKQ